MFLYREPALCGSLVTSVQIALEQAKAILYRHLSCKKQHKDCIRKDVLANKCNITFTENTAAPSLLKRTLNCKLELFLTKSGASASVRREPVDNTCIVHEAALQR